MKKQRTKTNDTPNDDQTTLNDAEEIFAGELFAHRWSVITFENCVAKNLSYADAAEKMQELKRQNIAGLCIVTDEAAARIKSSC